MSDIVIPEEAAMDALSKRGWLIPRQDVHLALEAALPALRRQWEAEQAMTPSQVGAEASRLHDKRVRVVVEGNLGQVAGDWIFPGESEIALEDVVAIREFGESLPIAPEERPDDDPAPTPSCNGRDCGGRPHE